MKVFRISGRIVDRTTRQGVKGLRVEAWDKDLLVSDLVGGTTTGDGGNFQIRFDESYFNELFFDRQPDLFFKVYKKHQLLKSTEDSMLWNVAGDESECTIEIDDKEDNSMPTPTEQVLQHPIEIPWKLASTTQRLKEGGPDDTTISMFYYEPDMESLKTDYPDEKLIYLKFTVSVSPYHYQPGKASFNDLARTTLEGELPVWHLLLDLKVTSIPATPDTIRPYFHAAAPLHRTMIETGVIGADAFEGQANGLSIGKSNSQLHETASWDSTTTVTKGGGGGWLDLGYIGGGGGGSKVTTTADGSSARGVNQSVDTMSRGASQERCELLSHMSNVANVLTLLTAKHVGSPYLRFSLWPRPLRTLSVDPSDPNLWYNQLLHRHSSGIEGVQEFFAVLAVPKDMEEFAVNATLRRICVLDEPPVPSNWDQEHYSDEEVIEYLDRLYPLGTPLDELDVDLKGDDESYVRPVVAKWQIIRRSGISLGPYLALIYVSPPSTPGGPPAENFSKLGYAAYKSIFEIYLGMYELDLARSPLERGVVLAQSLELDTNFSFKNGNNSLEVRPSTNILPPVDPVKVNFTPQVQPTPLHMHQYRGFTSPAYRHIHTVMSWNILENQLAKVLASCQSWPQEPISLASPRVFQILLGRWKKLAPDDPRNLALSEVGSILKLTSKQKCVLEDAGVKDLRGLARVIHAAPRIEKLNAKIQEFVAQLPEEEAGKLQPLDQLISTNDAFDIRCTISKVLQPSQSLEE